MLHLPHSADYDVSLISRIGIHVWLGPNGLLLELQNKPCLMTVIAFMCTAHCQAFAPIQREDGTGLHVSMREFTASAILLYNCWYDPYIKISKAVIFFQPSTCKLWSSERWSERCRIPPSAPLLCWGPFPCMYQPPWLVCVNAPLI